MRPTCAEINVNWVFGRKIFDIYHVMDKVGGQKLIQNVTVRGTNKSDIK